MEDTRISLVGIGSAQQLRSNSQDGFTYYIDELIGKGGSSLVYRAYYNLGQFKKYVLIKELYPYELSYQSLIARDDNGIIHIDDTAKDRWDEYRTIAINEQDATNYLRENQSKKTNDPYFFDQIETIEANGTIYSVLATEEGETLLELIRRSECENIDCGLSTMAEVCQVILRILEALVPMHSRGMLHLDISPDNIYFSTISLNGNRLARLIDFNSVYDLNILKNTKTCFSFKEGYSAFELSHAMSSGRITVNYSTDLFSVVAVMFRILKGATISDFSLHHFNSWKLDTKNRFCCDLSDSAIDLCNRILYKGLSFSPRNRYHSIDELKQEITSLYELCIQHPYSIRSNIDFSTIPEYFCGRETELKTIKADIEKNHYVVLQGMGGSGKTTLAFKYALENINSFSKVIVVKNSGTLINSFADDNTLHISGLKRLAGESIENYYKRKMTILGDLLDDSSLLIIDNVENFDDPIADALSLPGDMIITTRIDYSSMGIHCLEVANLTKNSAIKLLRSQISESKYNEDYALPLLELIGYHTLTIELLAKLIQLSSFSMQDVFYKLSIEHTSGLSEIKVANKKDSLFSFDTVTNHIKRIFEFSSLDESEKTTLYRLSFFERIDVQRSAIISLCNDNQNIENDLNHLALLGWIKIGVANDSIQIHPVIADVLDGQRKKENVFFDEFIQRCNLYLTVGFRNVQEVQVTKLMLQRNILSRYSFNSKDYELLFLANTGNLYREVGLIKNAEEIFKIALSIYCNHKNQMKADTVCIFANNYGLLHMENRNDPEEANYWFRIAEEGFRSSSDYATISTIDCNISLCYSKLKLHSQAIEYAKQACETARLIQDDAISFSFLMSAKQKLGLAYAKSGNIDLAIDELVSACELITQRGKWNDYRIYFICEIQLAELFRKKGDLDFSLELAQSALKTATDLEFTNQDIITAHINLAKMYAVSRLYEEAYEEYKIAFEMIDKTGCDTDSFALIPCFSKFGEQGFVDDLKSNTDDYSKAPSLCDYAGVCFMLEKYEEAHPLLVRAADTFLSLGFFDNTENVESFCNHIDWCINAMIASYMVGDLDSAKKFLSVSEGRFDCLNDSQKGYVKKYHNLIF